MHADALADIKSWIDAYPSMPAEEALLKGRALVEKHPHNTGLLSNVMILHARAGDYVSALDIARRVAALEPENQTARINKAQILLAMHRPHAALQLIKEVLRKEPENQSARNILNQAATAANGEAGAAENREMLMQRAFLNSGLAYLVAKLAASPREEAQRLLDIVNLDAYDSGAPAPAPEETTKEAALALLEKAIKGLAEQNYPEALRRFRAALLIFIALMERGEVGVAAELAHNAAERLVGSAWRPSDLVQSLAGGVVTFETGESPAYAFQSRVNLFCQTNETFTDLAHWGVSQLAPPAPEPALSPEQPTVLGVEQPGVMRKTIEDLDRDGYHVFEKKLSPGVIDRLTAFASSAVGEPVPSRLGKTVPFDPNDPELAIFFCDKQLVLEQPDVQSLLCDPAYLNVARQYLKCEPMFTTANLWWSLPREESKHHEDEAAQKMHFDGDWIQFINFFTYLTDVDEGGGPHAYVRGSHRVNTKPGSLMSQGYARVEDEELAKYYPKEDFVSVTAPPGTIIAGNTRCWHRGTRPTRKPRLILEFIFASTAANGAQKGYYSLNKGGFSPEYLGMVQSLPGVFRRQSLKDQLQAR
jgi:tetratricopeptide (TPR) repeat protein